MRLRSFVALCVLALAGVGIGVATAPSAASTAPSVILVSVTGQGSLPYGNVTTSIDAHGDLVVAHASLPVAEFDSGDWARWVTASIASATSGALAVTYDSAGDVVYFPAGSSASVGPHDELDVETAAQTLLAQFAPGQWQFWTEEG